MNTTDKVKTFIIGTITTILTSCGFNKEKVSQEDKEKAKTEQVVDEMSKQGISVFKKGAENAPDSVLESVDVVEPVHSYNSVQYSNPKYRAKTYDDSVNDVKLGKSEYKGMVVSESDVDNLHSLSSDSDAKEKINEIKAKLKAGENYHGLEMAKDKPTGNIKKQTFDYASESPIDNFNYSWRHDAEVQTNTDDYSVRHESTIYNGPKDMIVEFAGETYNFEDTNPDEEKISATPQKQEKKQHPKGSISKDAFINALLEQNEKRGGRK